MGMKTELIYSRMGELGDRATPSSKSASSSSSKFDQYLSTEVRRGLLQSTTAATAAAANLEPFGSSTSSEKVENSSTLPFISGRYFQLDPYYLTLNSAEEEMIFEVKAATRAAGFSEEEHLDIIGEVTDFNDALHLAQHYIRKIIKFCKSLTSFRAFSSDDQLIILKGFFSEMLILQIAYMFRPEWGAVPGLASEDSTTERVLLNFNLLAHSNKADWTGYLLGRCTYAHEQLEGDPLIRDLVSDRLGGNCTVLIFFSIVSDCRHSPLSAARRPQLSGVCPLPVLAVLLAGQSVPGGEVRRPGEGGGQGEGLPRAAAGARSLQAHPGEPLSGGGHRAADAAHRGLQ